MFDINSPMMQSAIGNILRLQRPDLPEEIDALFAVVKHYAVQLDAIKAQQDHITAILEKQYGPAERSRAVEPGPGDEPAGSGNAAGNGGCDPARDR